MKKFLGLILLLCFFCVPCYGANPDNDIFIIYTNDVHCGVDENIGYAGVGYFRDEAKKITPYVTIVDAGDWAQGNTMGAISNGRYILEIMNALDYDFAVPGNHEFDYGWSQFENFAKNLKCGFHVCNLRDALTGQLLFKPYEIFTYGKVKVAFVGAATPESITKSTPSTFMDSQGNFIYDFDGDMTGEKLCASIQNAADDARKNGADFVIVVGHLGEYEDVTEVWSAPYIAARTRNIDAFIDGHSHEITPALKIKNLDGKEINITQSGTKLKNIGLVKIKTSGEVTTELISSVDGKDEKINLLIEDIKRRYEDTLKTKLSYTDFILRALDDNAEWLVRVQETNLGDLVADASLASASESKTGHADIALYNAGSIRDNIKEGDITFKNALDILPFGNTMCLIEVSGQAVIDELEMGARLLPKRSGGFLQVSKNVEYTVDTRIPTPVIIDDKNYLIGIEGERRVKDVKINGEPIDPERKYIIAATNYLLIENGDGHMFAGRKILERDYAVDSDMFMHYLKTFEKIPESYGNVDGEGRIKIIK